MSRQWSPRRWAPDLAVRQAWHLAAVNRDRAELRSITGQLGVVLGPLFAVAGYGAIRNGP